MEGGGFHCVCGFHEKGSTQAGSILLKSFSTTLSPKRKNGDCTSKTVAMFVKTKKKKKKHTNRS